MENVELAHVHGQCVNIYSKVPATEPETATNPAYPQPGKYADRTIKGCHIFDARSLEGRDYGHTKIKLVRQTVSQKRDHFPLEAADKYST